MHVSIENRLERCMHVTAVREHATAVRFIISSAKRTVPCGEVLRHECLFPGTALALRDFDDRTDFTIAVEGFDGTTLDMVIGTSADDPETTLVILRGRKSASS